MSSVSKQQAMKWLHTSLNRVNMIFSNEFWISTLDELHEAILFIFFAFLLNVEAYSGTPCTHLYLHFIHLPETLV